MINKIKKKKENMENNMYYILITSPEKHTDKLHIMFKVFSY